MFYVKFQCFFCHFQADAEFHNIFRTALLAYKKRMSRLKTEDLKIGHVYKFNKIWANSNGRYGGYCTVQFKKGRYILPSGLSEILMLMMKKTKYGEKMYTQEGYRLKKSIRLRLKNIHKNGAYTIPDLEFPETPFNPHDPNEESSDSDSEQQSTAAAAGGLHTHTQEHEAYIISDEDGQNTQDSLGFFRTSSKNNNIKSPIIEM